MSHVNTSNAHSEYTAMEMNEWWPWYERIAKAFDYSRAKDQEATELLSELLMDRSSPIREFSEVLNDRRVIVFGAGPSLETDLERVVELNLICNYKTVVADGATSALLNIAKTVPDIIVSDLDGPLRDLVVAVTKGSKIVIHAHGDNMELLRSSAPSFSKALGSTQVKPSRNVYNFGGFTDGDRAVFLAKAMNASTVVLAGMDFGKKIGKYSKSRVQQPELKLRKLQFGKSLLEWLAERVGPQYYNITDAGEAIVGFKKIEPELLIS